MSIRDLKGGGKTPPPQKKKKKERERESQWLNSQEGTECEDLWPHLSSTTTILGGGVLFGEND